MQIDHKLEQMDPIFIYLCSRGQHELYTSLITERYHNVLNATMCISTSSEVPELIKGKKKVVLFTSNIFHKSVLPGLDGESEENMTGAKLAKIAKEINPEIKVYLFSEFTDEEPVFDGVFKRSTKKGSKYSKELIKFFNELEEDFEIPKFSSLPGGTGIN